MDTSAPHHLLATAWTEENADRLEAILAGALHANTPIPEADLLQLESALRPSLQESAATVYRFRFARAGGRLLRAYENLLLLLARQQVRGAREVILQARARCPALGGKAAEALALLEGVGDPQDFVRKRVSEVGVEGLTENQRLLYRVYELRWSEVLIWFEAELGDAVDGGDGHGDDALERCYREQEERERDTVKGLRAIGAHATADVLEATLRGGPWDALEEQLRDGEDVVVLMFDFARAHPDEFRPQAK